MTHKSQAKMGHKCFTVLILQLLIFKLVLRVYMSRFKIEILIISFFMANHFKSSSPERKKY